MKCVIYGSGGVGGYYGGCLQRADHEVSFIARGDHLQAMKKGGLEVRSHLGCFRLDKVRVDSSHDPAFEADLIIVAVKAWQLESISRELASMCTENTLILPLLNGVDAAELIGRDVEKERVLGGLTRIFSRIETPGVINHFAGSTLIRFGELSESIERSVQGEIGISKRCHELEQILDAVPGIDAEASPEIKEDLWRKAMLFVPLSACGSVTRTPIGTFREIPETRQILETTILEVVSIGKAQGVNLTEEDYNWAIKTIGSVAPDSTSSLQRDIIEGRPSELHAIHGNLLRRAEESKVDAPNLRFLYHALIPSETIARGDIKSP